MRGAVILDCCHDYRVIQKCFPNDRFADELVAIEAYLKLVDCLDNCPVQSIADPCASSSNSPEGEAAGEEDCDTEQNPVAYSETQTASGISPVLSY